MKKIFIDMLSPGDTIDEAFALAEKTILQKRDGNQYLNIVLADRSGQIKGVVWDNVRAIAEAVASGDFVRVTGSVSEYRGTPQLVVKTMVPVPPASVTADDFLPATDLDVDQLLERLIKLTRSMTTPWLKQLFTAFWQDEALVARFKKAPAAKMMHHAYLGGLLVHCLSMAVLADKIAAHYNGLDRDLLIAGAILHDIGKLHEFEYSAVIDYSDEGRLLSHIVIGLEMLDQKLGQIPDVPRDQANLLKHMIISHHGDPAFGALEPPKTIEAVVLHYIDDLDSKVNAVRDFMAKEDPSQRWTSYHRILGRHFYLGHDQGTPGKHGSSQ
ncbi:MAG: HD domain-containing protein [Desulfobacterales bacterium]|jgi:3'-5' exoribonuclease